MAKINVENPIVEMDGDEMSHVIWDMIKSKLIHPFLEVDLVYFDLSIQKRDETSDQVTREAALATLKHHVAVKCSTITPDEARVQEFGLKRMWDSSSSGIRNLLNGTVFREPVVLSNVPRPVPGWKQPIVIARHAYGDHTMASEMVLDVPGKVKMVFAPADGSEPRELEVCNLEAGGGVAMGMFNCESSMYAFAEASMAMAYQKRLPLYLSTKNTINKKYDGRFKDIFLEVYEKSWKSQFAEVGISYQHRLIDDMVSLCIKGQGGFVWACKNYDGDVMSDMVAQGFGSLGLMTSMLQCPDNKTVLSESVHGTVARHYRVHQKGGETSTNSIALIYTWSRGLAQRAKLDGNEKLGRFAAAMEEACVQAVEAGQMTKDLALQIHGKEMKREHYLNTEAYIDAVAERLHQKVAAF